MSTPLPVHCGNPDCDADISGYDHVCSSQHLQYRIGKGPSFVLLASSLLAIHLFHVSGEFWPMYLLASMGLVHAFAIAFSRGRALGHTAVYVSVVVSSWLLWELAGGSRFQLLRSAEPLISLRTWIQTNPVPVVIFVLVASTVWIFLVGNATALDGLHETARLYLSVGAFILCTWGAWGLLIQIGEVPDWLVKASLLATLASPLVIIIAHSGMVVTLDSKLLALTFWMTLLTGYLAVARPLVNKVAFFLRELLPDLVGRPQLQEFDELWVFKYTDWMSQISLVLQIVALFSLGAASLTRTIDSFQVKVPTWYSAWKLRRADYPAKGIAMILLAPVEWAMVFANLATNLALMIIEFVRNLVVNIIMMIRQIPRFVTQIVQLLVVPVATFAAISMAFIIVLQDLRRYVLQFQDVTAVTPTVTNGTGALFEIVRDVRTLWGEAVTVVLLALIIGAVTFIVADPKFRNEGLAAICIVFLGYLAMTAIGSALAFTMASMRSRIELPFHFEIYGDLLRTNLILVVLLVVLVVCSSLPAAIGSIRNPSGATGAINLTMILVILPLLGFTGYALILGMRPVLSSIQILLGG